MFMRWEDGASDIPADKLSNLLFGYLILLEFENEDLLELLKKQKEYNAHNDKWCNEVRHEHPKCFCGLDDLETIIEGKINK